MGAGFHFGKRASKGDLRTIFHLDPCARVRGDQGSGLRAILETIDLPRNARVLDLGAGGFCGKTTTVHLATRFAGPIDAIELQPDRAERLRERFGQKVSVTVEDAFSTPFEKYDLIVSDLYSGLIPRQLTELLAKAREALSPGGYFVCTFIYNCGAVSRRGEPLVDAAVRPRIESFLTRIGGASEVTTASLATHFESVGFDAVAIVNKWLGWRAPRGIGWLVLRKQAAPVP